MKKIVLLTTGHSPFDERIFNKFAYSLKSEGFNTSILCSNEEIDTVIDGISITGFNGNNLKKSEKITKLYKLLTIENPDLIICCEPFTVIAARRFKRSKNAECKIVMDITEWYPEGYISRYNGIKKILFFVIQYLFNFLMVTFSDGLIIGEESKKKRYDFISPFKPKKIIGYYPVIKYFQFTPHFFNKNSFTLCYAGILNEKRGFFTFLKYIKEISSEIKNTKIKIKVIGKFLNNVDETRFLKVKDGLNNVDFEFTGWVPYKNLSEHLKDVDICCDLRHHNFVFDNSLPIKIFEYMAAGKPVVYTDIKPIRMHLPIEDIGFLVEPDDKEEFKRVVKTYIDKPELLTTHSMNGRKLIEEKFNWEIESEKLISFIKIIC